MSPKLKQFFQDSKTIILHRGTEKAKLVKKERPANAVVAEVVYTGLLVGSMSLVVSTGGGMAAAFMSGAGYLAITHPNIRGFVKSKFDNKKPPSP